jgi:phage-related tail fiber protein
MVREDSGDKQAAGTDSTMSESGVPTGPASTEQQPGQDQQAGPAQQAGESETVENVRALMQQLESAAPAVQPRRILTRTGAARRVRQR